MATKAAVVIPVYKAELNEFEKISLVQCKRVLGKYPIIFAAPAGAKFSYFAQGNAVAYFPPQFFQSVKTYNYLMMSPGFYDVFKDFDYILIYQLDAFVFYDALEYFCSLGYDYIGAPWPYYARRNFSDLRNVRVGNGGFSLRNVKAHVELLTEQADLVTRMTGTPEDDFFAYCGAREDINFSVPPVDIAARFSVEYLLEHSLRHIGNRLPFGCHGWTKMDADFYVKLFAQFGYDLRPLRNKMRSIDYDMLHRAVLNYSSQRLNRRLQRGQSLTRYLPRRDFASVRVVRHPAAMVILARLMLENPALADKIFLYDPDEQDLLLNDLMLQKQPHLIITWGGGYDTDLISAVEQRGFAYGKRVVSFWREYLTSCEELFRKLGK